VCSVVVCLSLSVHQRLDFSEIAKHVNLGEIQIRSPPAGALNAGELRLVLFFARYIYISIYIYIYTL